ncbi:ribokinase [Solanum tuberosum]|uniref:Ribokinase n=1 Tax=Solanum tuberosum TaxID=4113 RepID=M1AA65_SOLTU|nr:PREDICTED: ribokinase [Solanum tuberosum]XP_006348342.1 PREDICTED: ribokinase [Solanum tuberosum]XP_006348343.1 PREDICTED: ribokinase [Solanum tuberosum]XP_015164654.1 PREDICTED: ribokinase [Solanum tuberosum]
MTQTPKQNFEEEEEKRDSVENMKGLTTPLQSKYWHPTSLNNLKNPESFNLYSHPVQFNGKNNNPISRKVKPISCFASENTNQPILKESKPPLVVVGSANADIYVEIDRLPKEGETISAKTGQTLAGGKGANQAVCGGKLDYPTFFVGQVGEDAHGKLITEALESGGVCVDHLTTVSNAPTGNAVVMLQSDGENSIIIVGGANMSCWPDELSYEDLEIVRSAGIVLLQREIPDFVNIQVAKAARNAGVPVILDAGGADSPIPLELLRCVEIFSPNETELARITKMPTGNFEQISNAVEQCYDLGVNQVLVKLGANGSALFTKGEEPLRQPIIKAAKVIDTTGAGDTFTAAFAVALVEGKSKEECLRFAAAAASLCVQVKGAIPSMPEKRAVFNLLQSA